MHSRRLFAGIAAVTAGLTVACSDHQAARSGVADPVAVTTATVTLAEITDTFEAGGVVQARTTATLTARILAPVREVRVTPGDRVRAGQVLVVLDGSDLTARARSAGSAAAAADQSIASATADRQAADAALTLARTEHARIVSLHAKRSATAQELDLATAALRRAEAAASSAASRVEGARSGLDSARAAAEAASTTASFASIVAPFDGVVTEKLVEPGNMASPGTPLVRLEDIRGFRLDATIDASRAGTLRIGDTVKVTLDPDICLDARIAEISRAIDADSRAFLVKIDLPEASVRSGQFGRASFPAGSRRGLTVPEAAVTRRGQVSSVFVAENGVARLRLVSVRGTEVLAGLVEGDVVILDPPPGLTDGRPITVGGAR